MTVECDECRRSLFLMATLQQAQERLSIRRPGAWRSVLLFLSVVGPGIITANADNDVGGITTYSLSGAQFGYSQLWILIPVTVALLVIQEMCARMGAVTGKGLADLIRENFGVKLTFWVLLLFILGNVGTITSEFAGVASAAGVFHTYLPWLTKFLLVPVVAIFVFTVVTRGNYAAVEKVFFFFCFVYLTYVVSCFIVRPDWHEAMTQFVWPHFTATKAYLLMAIAIIGTTISPWMQFYIQAAIVEKGAKASELRYVRIDVVTGALFTDFIAFFIMVAAAATIYVHNVHAGPTGQIVVDDVNKLAVALAPLAGKWASLLFAIGLLNAGVFTASILPLSTAYYVCEAFGFESGVEKKFRDARFFYSLYAALIVIGAAIVLIPRAPLLDIIFWSQVLNGALLPLVLVLMLLLINNKMLMGAYTNNPVSNIVSWATVIIVSVLTLISTLQLIFPSLGG
jgi:NRAMP (natural resistance-associated macrophage protein)-like metal ion transporter